MVFAQVKPVGGKEMKNYRCVAGHGTKGKRRELVLYHGD